MSKTLATPGLCDRVWFRDALGNEGQGFMVGHSAPAGGALVDIQPIDLTKPVLVNLPASSIIRILERGAYGKRAKEAETMRKAKGEDHAGPGQSPG